MRAPRTFEQGLFVFLVFMFVWSYIMEESTLGRLVLGHKSELFPMSTFSVYLSPKLQATGVYYFEVLTEKGAKPQIVRDYDMFHPIRPPDLDDEIATNQLDAFVRSYEKRCPEFRTVNYRVCENNPAKFLQLQPDIQAMWLRSIRHHLKFEGIPYAITLKKKYYKFGPEDLMTIDKIDSKTFFTIYPREGWVAYVQ